MPSLHRKIYYKASQAIGLAQGAMKLSERNFNKEFIEVKANVDQVEAPIFELESTSILNANELED